MDNTRVEFDYLRNLIMLRESSDELARTIIDKRIQIVCDSIEKDLGLSESVKVEKLNVTINADSKSIQESFRNITKMIGTVTRQNADQLANSIEKLGEID